VVIDLSGCGQVPASGTEFAGLIGRRFRPGTQEAKYVSQVEIGSSYENNTLEAAFDIVDTLPWLKWLLKAEGQKHPGTIPPNSG